MAFVQRLAVADRHHHVLQAVAVALVVVHVPGADHAYAGALRQRHQRAVARAVTEDVVVLEFHEYAVRPKPAHEAAQRLLRVGVPPGLHQPRDVAFAAAGEHDQPCRVMLQLRDGDARVEPSLLLRRRLLLMQAEGDAGEAAEVGVALSRLRQQCEVGAGAVLAVLAVLLDGLQLQRGDRPQPRLLRVRANSSAPYRPWWSLSASARCPCSRAASTSSPMLDAPSSSE